MAKKLFIVADDYGVHNLIDTGIHNCIDKDAVDCVAIIVTHESSKNRIKTLINKYPDRIQSGKLKIGLHLNVNVGSLVYKPTSSDLENPHFNDYLRFITKKRNSGNKGMKSFRHAKVDDFVGNLANLETIYLDFLKKEMWAQYHKMCAILSEIFGEDRKPDHISSHNGVFQGTQPLYENYSELCREEGIHMRNPTMLTFDSAIGQFWQNKPKQKLVPIGRLKIASKYPGDKHKKRRVGAKKVLDWIKNGQDSYFKADLIDGLQSTDYTMEHFYRNGEERHLVDILKKLGDYSYEMIVHPMTYTNLNDRKGLPMGINKTKGVIRDRKKEMELLTSGVLQAWRANGLEEPD